MATLVQLSESDKRIIFTVILIAIIIFAVIGLLGSIVVRVMKWQGKKIDTLCHDVTVTRVIDNKKDFIKYGRKKNWREFFKQGWIPVLILVVDVAFLLIYESVVGWNYNPFSMDNGFGTLLFTWKLSETEYINLWLFAFRKWELTHSPVFVASAWPGYVFVPILIGAGLWYLVTIQCLLARTIRLYKLGSDIFSKSLEGYNQQKAITDEVNNGVNVNNNNLQ